MGELISFSELNYKELFEALPGMFIALKPDFTIAAVSNQFLKVSMTTREKVIGTYLFDLFPDNPADPDTKGVENLKASLQYVLASKEQHTMVLQKYDIRRPDGRFEVRYWSPVNSPVVDENNEIKFIIHRVEDVTDFVMAKENQYLNRNSDKPLENIEAELFEQEKELKIVNLAKQELENKVKQRTEELLKANEDYKELAKELENKVLIRTSELNAEREKLFNLFMNAPAIICVFKGPEHIFEFANPLYYQLYGNRELIGKTVREALPELEGQVFFDLLDNVYKTGKTFTGKEIPGQINKKYDGNLEEVYFNFVYEPVYNIKNEVEGISVFAFDITEQVMARKQVEKLNSELHASEAKYRALAESLEVIVQERTRELSAAHQETQYEKNKLHSVLTNAPAYICLLEQPGHIFAFTNPLYQRLVGGRNVIGKPVREAIPEAEGQGFFELLDSVYSSGQPFIGKEQPLSIDKTGDGTLSLVYLNFVYQPVFNINREVEGVSVFAFDVTEQVFARKKSEKLNAELTRSNSELQNFAHVASHDLQEPLRSITSYSQLLAGDYGDKIDANGKRYIDYIVTSTKRMQSLIKDLLSHSQIRINTKSDFSTDLNNIMEIIRSNLRLAIEENQAVIKYEQLPVVKAENTYMVQLFQNLISNAIKYRKKGEPPVVKISSKDMQHEWLFCIIDNGIGIPKEYFSKVFNIFQRLHRKEEYEGTGIGLASCKKIVDLYGGRIWVDSEAGKGSTFFFTLPK